MSEFVTLRLTVDVRYECNGVPVDVLEDLLRYIPRDAAKDCMMSDDTDATVDEWSAKVERIG